MLNKIFIVIAIVVTALFAIPWVWNFIHPVAGLILTAGFIYGFIRLIQHWFKDM